MLGRDIFGMNPVFCLLFSPTCRGSWLWSSVFYYYYVPCGTLRHVVFSATVAVCLIDSSLCFCMPLRPLPSKLLISCKARKSMPKRHRPCAHPITHAHTKRRVHPVLEWTWHGVIIVEPEQVQQALTDKTSVSAGPDQMGVFLFFFGSNLIQSGFNMRPTCELSLCYSHINC